MRGRCDEPASSPPMWKFVRAPPVPLFRIDVMTQKILLALSLFLIFSGCVSSSEQVSNAPSNNEPLVEVQQETSGEQSYWVDYIQTATTENIDDLKQKILPAKNQIVMYDAVKGYVDNEKYVMKFSAIVYSGKLDTSCFGIYQLDPEYFFINRSCFEPPIVKDDGTWIFNATN